MDIDLHGKKILWVEDDKFLSSIVEKKIANSGATLLLAVDGEHALHMIDEEIPDIIVCDIILPTIDGFEILKRVKESPRTKDVPFILLSNLGHVEDIEKGRQYGADLFLVKAAVNLDEVLVKIKDLTTTKPVIRS